VSALQPSPRPGHAVPWGDIPDLTQRIRAPAGKAPRAQALICRWLLEHGADRAPVVVSSLAAIGRECGLSRRSTLQATEAMARRGVVTVERSGGTPYARSISVELPPRPEPDGDDGQLSLLDLLPRRC